jgi:hypothetical protein
MQPAQSDFIDRLASALYFQENIDRATQYLKTRGADNARFKFPWVATGPEMGFFTQFKDNYPPQIFVNSLYIPIVDVRSDPDKPQLAGFDVRYIGDEDKRLRWHKFKRTPTTPLIYNSHIVETHDTIIVAEGALDAEAFQRVGYPAIGALTSHHSPRFVYFLIALGKKVLLAYDNDDNGKKATEKILLHQAKYPPLATHVTPLLYPAKDPAKALELLGPPAFKLHIEQQITQWSLHQ